MSRHQLSFPFTTFKFRQRLSSVSLNSQTPFAAETNIDEAIHKHSIPNNLRQQPIGGGKSRVLPSRNNYHSKPDNIAKSLNIDVCDKEVVKTLPNYSKECSSSSLLRDIGGVDIVGDSSVKLTPQYDERPSVHSSLLSTAFIWQHRFVVVIYNIFICE